MVLETRVDYGFSGFQVPVFPRASRSARVRVPLRKKSRNGPKRSFEILASVAGELLQGSQNFLPTNFQEHRENTTKNIVLKENEDEEQLNHCKQENCNEKTFIQGNHQIFALNNLKACSSLKNFDWSEKICLADQLSNVNERNSSPAAELGISYFESVEGKLNGEGSELTKDQTLKSAARPVTGSLDMLEKHCKSPALFCSESKLNALLLKDWISLGPSKVSTNIETASKDDDDNYISCTQAARKIKAIKFPSTVADQRIENLSASGHWKVPPNFNLGASFQNDGKKRSILQAGRTRYTRQRSQRIYPFKKRKFFNQRPISASARSFHFEEIFSGGTRTNGDNCSAAVGVAASVAGPHLHSGSRDRNVGSVKLRIKSFKVPELFVEIPTTATVGLLKRAVMDAVTTVLGDGLHVGILLKGEKVRDDSKTLLQTGISQDHKLHKLGFTLEPRHTEMIPPPCLVDRELTRHAFTLEAGTRSVSLVPTATNCSSEGESDLHAVSANSSIPNPQPLKSVPAISMEALAVVPFHHRPGCHKFVQRRIRRPFSVSEVEALVQAVENLGTGRWRDVKLCAFNNAKHRTYVDLKDKWKTLVHTARISPQQRRGEPVPQELLDRVLAAHASWSQHQAKQQLKSVM